MREIKIAVALGGASIVGLLTLNAQAQTEVYVKGGYSFAVSRQSEANGGVPLGEPKDNGWAVDGGVVFTTPLSEQLRPYVDFAALIRSDRRMLIPGVGLRYDILDIREKFLPFVTFGMGYNISRWTEPFTNLTSENQQGQSFTATAQAGFDYYISDHFALDLTLRGDLYYLTSTVVDGAGVSQLTDKASLSALGGLVYRFGEPAKKPQDEDHDGVEDALDHCPGTEVDTWVDKEGCPFKPEPCEPEVIEPKRDLGDNDKDGVVNADDQCPDTLENVPVNEAGCPRFVFSYNVDFEYNQYTIDHVLTRPDINVLEFLKKNANYKVQLVGYADNVGSDKFNEQLAKMRADEGLSYFLDGGIERSRIEVIGRGEHESLRKNDTEENRSENRRVEVTFYREGALAK